MIILNAPEGYYYSSKDNFIIAKTLYLGIKDFETNYKLITDAEAMVLIENNLADKSETI